MIEKTALMQEFEKENPGKHAIWNGEITEQFKIWKEIKTNPDYNPRYIYQGKDGFKIVRKTWIHYYSKTLRTAVNTYGLSKDPDWKTLETIGTAIFEYMARASFRFGYPVYCEEAYHGDICKIAGVIAYMKDEKLKTDQDHIDFCKKLIEMIDEADTDNYSNCMSR